MNISGPNAYWSADPWDLTSYTGGIRQAQSIGERESDKIANKGVHPTDTSLVTGTKPYMVPAAYMGVWATKQELPAGRECALPGQTFDPKPWIYEKPYQTCFIRTG